MRESPKPDRRRLVEASADRLRDLILASAPDTQIGSLTDIARELGVGVVTVQQAARILEHEGLLQVRRGPGGGYYGKRPTEASLERSIAGYLRVDSARFRELFEMTSLLECELAPAAARSRDADLKTRLERVLAMLARSDTIESQLAVEEALHDVLFRMADHPLMGLLGRVTMSVYKASPAPSMFLDQDGIDAWRAGRRRIVDAIQSGDEDLARFETVRYRQDLLVRLRRLHGEARI
ncbi:FCD domain-containing protein [Phenylobacterium sp. LjRoot225]|uniref:FadR/GntR family transcriptional regulator n=1 Tax=Phenylobacterium sp. LjRoot225 TaxID=3342285 RepID=UPI003ECC4D8E